MRLGSAFAIIATLLIVAGGITAFGPWHESPGATMFLAPTKVFGLIVAGIAALAVFRQHGEAGARRRPWALLGVGFLSMAGGQSVLAYHQLVLHIHAPFPSAGDPLFVAAAILIIWALTEFALLAFGSGLAFGTAARFWSPALLVALLFIASGYPVLGPVLHAEAPATETFLNLFYPVASFATLAPLAVMQRVGLRFRGGRLLYVWIPLTFGFGCVLVSDILFAYFTTFSMSWLAGALDFLYLSGYLLIPIGLFFQLDLLRS